MVRKRQNRSVRSSPSPVVKSNWAYTPEQEKLLWEAFAMSMYPSVNRKEELAEELGLSISVVKQFFSSKRFCHFRRLCEAGKADKVPQILQANNVPLSRCQAWKNKAAKLDKQEHLEKLQKKGKVKQESPAWQTEQDGTVSLNIHMSQNLYQGQPLLQQQHQQQNQQHHFTCLREQVHHYQQQQFPPQQTGPSQEYQYGLGGQQLDPWGNTPSMPYLSVPIPTPGYNGPYHLSTGSSSGPLDDWTSGVNTVWAANPPGQIMNINTWNTASAVDLSVIHNRGRTNNDSRFTQNMTTTDCTYSTPTHTHGADFSRNHSPGLDQNPEQSLRMGQYQDNRCWNLSGTSAPSIGLFPPPATATNTNTHYQTATATQYPSHAMDPNPSQDFYSGPAHYPTPEPSPSTHDPYLPTIHTLYPSLSPDQPSATPQSHGCNPVTDHSGKAFWWDSAQKTSVAKASNNSCCSHQSPSTLGKGINQDDQSFHLGPLQVPSPPLDSTPSVPALSVAPLNDLPNTAPPDHCSYTQPAVYGGRMWMAMGNSFSTQEDSTPDPNHTFTYYPNISGVELEGREEDRVCSVSQILQEVNTIFK